MVTNATAGPGFLLKMGDGGGPEVFTTLAEVKDIRGPSIRIDTEDATNQSSPDFVEEIIPTLIRPGEVTFDVNFDPTSATHDTTTGFLAALFARTKKNWELHLNNVAASYWSFAGYVVGFDGSLPVTGISTGSITIKITGKPVLTV
jgi:hypothetical protein